MCGVAVTRLFTGSSPYKKGHYCDTKKHKHTKPSKIVGSSMRSKPPSPFCHIWSRDWSPVHILELLVAVNTCIRVQIASSHRSRAANSVVACLRKCNGICVSDCWYLFIFKCMIVCRHHVKTRKEKLSLNVVFLKRSVIEPNNKTLCLTQRQ